MLPFTERFQRFLSLGIHPREHQTSSSFQIAECCHNLAAWEEKNQTHESHCVKQQPLQLAQLQPCCTPGYPSTCSVSHFFPSNTVKGCVALTISQHTAMSNSAFPKRLANMFVLFNLVDFWINKTAFSFNGTHGIMRTIISALFPVLLNKQNQFGFYFSREDGKYSNIFIAMVFKILYTREQMFQDRAPMNETGQSGGWEEDVANTGF